MACVPGVVAVQGDYEKHASAFGDLGFANVRRIREPADLYGVTHAVIPGGESTAVGLLMRRFGLDQALISAARVGLALWGTCMGMIVMASHVEGREQPLLGILDITVRRNAFGTQVHSFEDYVEVKPLPDQVAAVFIRAPIIVAMGSSVEDICQYQGHTVGVRQNRHLGTSFHPELTPERSMHEYFLSL